MLEDKYSMEQKYLIAKATNNITGITLQIRDLNGARFELTQKKLAKDFAQKYAEKLSHRTQQSWTGHVEEYTPGIVKA